MLKNSFWGPRHPFSHTLKVKMLLNNYLFSILLCFFCCSINNWIVRVFDYDLRINWWMDWRKDGRMDGELDKISTNKLVSFQFFVGIFAAFFLQINDDDKPLVKVWDCFLILFFVCHKMILIKVWQIYKFGEEDLKSFKIELNIIFILF